MGEVRKRLGSLRRRLVPPDQRVGDVGGELEALRERVGALEREVQENRELNRRLAELTDIVTELLVPLSQRDDAKVEELLEHYRRSL